MDPESRPVTQTANSSERSILRNIGRYLLSAIKIGYEDGLDPSGYNFASDPAGRPLGDSSVERVSLERGRNSNGSSPDDSSGRRDTQHSKGYAKEVAGNEPGDAKISPRASGPGNTSITADPGHNASSEEHGGRDPENNQGSPAGIGSGSIDTVEPGSNREEASTSSRQPIWNDGAYRWSDGRCTDGSTQVCIPATTTLVSEVYNQSSQARDENVNDPSQVVWNWTIEYHKNRR